MSLTVFLALCILGLDFMIYVLFQWTYGDKRCAIVRQVAVHRTALKEQSPRPFVVTSQKTALRSRELPGRVGECVAKSKPRDPAPRDTYKERLA